MITLILGGNKSGKSARALNLLVQGPAPRVLLATGRARDLSFRQQILAHRESRDPDIPVIEVGPDLPERLNKAKDEYSSILVDSMDFWLFAACEEGCERTRVEAFMQTLEHFGPGRLILVSCEIGLGPLPLSREAREFVRRLGGLNQKMAALAHEVELVVAGQPLTLKKG